jgi:hypothetical protein
MEFEISTNFILGSPLSIKIVSITLEQDTGDKLSFEVNLLMKFIRLAKVIGGLFILLLNKLNQLLVGLEFSSSKNLHHISWLVMHEGLPTNDFRNTRHLTTNTTCFRCGATIENDMHTLRDCHCTLSILEIFLSYLAT